MLANVATNMVVSRTVLGLVPALLRTKVAMIFAMLYFDSAAAIVKPPRRSMMTCDHIAEKMNFVALSEVIRRCGFSGSLTTRSMTTRNGTRSDVTNNGIA